MNIKIYILCSLLSFATQDLISMDPGLARANQGTFPDDKIARLGQQFENLRKNKSGQAGYVVLAREIRKQNLTSAQFMSDLLRRKRREVVQEIATEWKIRDEDRAALMALHDKELNKPCPEAPFHYSIEAPADQADYFREKTTAQSFKDLINNTLGIGRARKFIIRFEESEGINSISADNLGFSAEREMKYGPLSANMCLNLSKTFFDLSPEKQEVVLGHEAGHNILLHHFLSVGLSHYLVDSMIIKHVNEVGVTFDDWINRKAIPERWELLLDILEANYDDKAPLLQMVRSSDEFCKLAHTLEVEADLCLPLRDLALTERFERVMVAKLETDKALNRKTAESHPPTEERVLWISALRKLQQAEQRL